MTIRLPAALGAAVLTFGLWSATPRAHEGHDHGDAGKSAPAAQAPRGTSSTDGLELVAVARNGTVTVFVDRVSTNEPVTDASVTAETPEGTATVTAAADGSYRLDAHWSEKPGEYDVPFHRHDETVFQTFSPSP